MSHECRHHIDDGLDSGVREAVVMETHQEFRDEFVVEHDNGICILITESRQTDRQTDRR